MVVEFHMAQVGEWRFDHRNMTTQKMLSPYMGGNAPSDTAPHKYVVCNGVFCHRVACKYVDHGLAIVKRHFHLPMDNTW